MNEIDTPRLLDVMIDVARAASVPDVLRRVVASARELVGAADVSLAVRAPDGTITHLDDTHELPADNGILRVPITVRSEDYGTLALAPDPARHFTERDVTIVTALATAAGVAVENATLASEVLQRQRWLAASDDINRALLTGLDLPATLRFIASRAREVAGGTLAGIARPHPHNRSVLVFEVVEPGGPDADRLEGLSVPNENTMTGVAFTTRQPVLVGHYGEHVLEQQSSIRDELPPMVANLDSAVAIPLVAGEEALGVLAVARISDKAPFTATEVALTRSFAAHAALAIQFARAEQDRQRLAVFEDRDRIARDLHDLVIQRLFATGLGLEGVVRRIPEPKVAEQVTQFAQDLDRTIREIRNTIFKLQQPDQAEHSLRSELLRTVVDAAATLGFEPRIGFDGPLDAAVPDPVRSDLLATLREALSNVAQHAAATTAIVDVGVDRSGRELTLVVSDDGVGMPAAPARRSGTANIAERAARWHGRSSLEPAPDGGSRLVWTVTLPRREAAS